MAATTTQLPPPTTQPSPTLHDLHGTMTATQDQLALTKASRAGAVSTSTRQAVPAFLNKLYNMVSNPDTDELVRWSDEGDSFYIPSHERLSKELLPRFFKHGNFSSFVRQLNMYGFHKVPHLQQGVLQNSTESELWQFQNPHFQRGQPDLLCLITRKKTGGNADNAPDDTQHSTHAIASNGSAHSSGPSSGPLDMTVLTSSLSAIKKHQTSLSTELKTLQESNQHLWNEALAARDRHKKHQDTINKILKFLASVFGNGATGSPAAGPGASSPGARDGRASPGALVPRKRPRLMIEDGSASRDHESDDEEFVHFSLPVDHEMSEARISEAPSEGAPSPASVPAPVPDSRPANPLAKSESPPTPALATPLISQTAPPFPAAPPMNSIARRSSSQSTVPTTSTPSNPPEPHPTPQEFNPEDPQAQDHLYQETISKLLSSPSTLQRILATLSAAGPDAAPYQSELAPYYGGLMNGGMMNAPAGGMMNLPAAEGDLDPAIAYNAARLDQATDAVGAEVESVSQDINTLMREWGISPDMLQDHSTNGFGDFTAGANPNGYVPPPGTDASNFTQPYASIAPSNDAHVDIDTFLNQFEFPDDPSTDDPASFPVTLPAQFDLENPGPQSAAFLDEVHPVPSAASDTSLSPAIPLLDDFGVGSGVGIGPPSPNAQKFATPTAQVPNGAPPKRGKKRRSVETASLQEHVRPTRR